MYDSATGAYIQTLQIMRGTAVRTPGTVDQKSVGSEFGTKVRPTREILGYEIEIRNPLDRIIRTAARPINVPYAVANALWVASGRSDADFISYFNSRGQAFAEDDGSIWGAYGPRILENDGINQIAEVCKRIVADPTNRRTFIPIYEARDNGTDAKYIPCPVGMQIALRDGKVHAVTLMRSQSMAMVFVYDVFLFTFLQEMITRSLSSMTDGVSTGSYQHYCVSLHYYEDEQSLVDKAAEEVIVPTKTEIPAMPETPNPFDCVRQIVDNHGAIISEVESQKESFDVSTIFNMPQYWLDIATILGLATLKKLNIPVSEYKRKLHSYYEASIS